MPNPNGKAVKVAGAAADMTMPDPVGPAGQPIGPAGGQQGDVGPAGERIGPAGPPPQQAPPARRSEGVEDISPSSVLPELRAAPGEDTPRHQAASSARLEFEGMRDPPPNFPPPFEGASPADRKAAWNMLSVSQKRRILHAAEPADGYQQPPYATGDEE